MSEIYYYYRINDTFKNKIIEDVYVLHKPKNKILNRIKKFIVSLLVKAKILKPYTEHQKRIEYEKIEINFKKLSQAIEE